MLMALLLVSFSSISQTITQNKAVVLTENQARAVVKDLVKGQAASAELKFTREALDASQQQNDLLREDLQNQQDISSNLELAMKEQQKIIDEQDRAIKSHEKSLQQCGRTALFWKIAAGAAIIGGIVLATQ